MSNTCGGASGVALLRSTVGLCGCCHFHGKSKVKNQAVCLVSTYTFATVFSFTINIHKIFTAVTHFSRSRARKCLHRRNFRENVFHSRALLARKTRRSPGDVSHQRSISLDFPMPEATSILDCYVRKFPLRQHISRIDRPTYAADCNFFRSN